jgi:branched-chain amino acid transport system permease protein
LFLFVVVTLGCSALYASSIGRAWSSIGLNKRLAESLGVNVTRYRLLAFIISSAIAGFIGSFYAHYTGFIIPDIFNMFVNVYIQIYAILGGIGYVILGPLLGSAIMTMIPETMRMAQQMSYLLVGVFLVVLIMFLPRGLLGLFEKDGALRQSFNKIASRISSMARPGVN